MLLSDLSEYLIKEIVANLKDNLVDQISLVFTCKRLFSIRDKIMGPLLNFDRLFSAPSQFSKSYYQLLLIVNKNANAIKLKSFNGMLDQYVRSRVAVLFNGDQAYLSDEKIKTLNYLITMMDSDTPNIPSSMTNLTHLICQANIISWDHLPPSIEYLNYSHSKQPMIGDQLPSTLRELYVGYWSGPIQSLPSSLERLTWDCSKQLTNTMLPASLKNLSIRCNVSIEKGVFPHGMESLDFGDYFNSSIPPGEIPPTVKKLRFGRPLSSCEMDSVIPSSVTHLELRRDFQTIQPGLLPPHLRKLKLTCECYEWPLLPGSLPHGLQSLDLTIYSGITFNASPGTFPTTITHMKYKYITNIDTDYIPFDSKIDLSSFPQSLISLSLDGGEFNQAIPPNSLPPNLCHLDFGRHLRHPLKPGSIPKTIRSLAIGDLVKLTSGVLLSPLVSLKCNHRLLYENIDNLVLNSIPNLQFDYLSNEGFPLYYYSNLKSVTIDNIKYGIRDLGDNHILISNNEFNGAIFKVDSSYNIRTPIHKLSQQLIPTHNLHNKL